MPASTIRGIEFAIDDAGQRVAVIIDLCRHADLWEDFYDSLVACQRRNEPRVSLAEVKLRLAKPHAGRASD